MINILRDIPEDLRFGRCYIPKEALERYNLSPEDLMDDKNIDAFFGLPECDYHEMYDASDQEHDGNETTRELESGGAQRHHGRRYGVTRILQMNDELRSRVDAL